MWCLLNLVYLFFSVLTPLTHSQPSTFLLIFDVKSSLGLFTIVMDEVGAECLACDFVVSVGLG